MEPEGRRPELRVGDAEREQTLEHLRDAHAEGRLDADEFYQRLDRVYAARTFGDLDGLVADLPRAGTIRFPAPPPSERSAVAPPTADAAPPVPSQAPSAGFLSAMPTGLRAAWVLWATVVMINLIVWGAVELGNGAEGTYFWPGWVAGPWGAVLFGSTALWWVNRGGDPPREIER